MTDEQLQKALAESQPPKPSPALDARVMASYRDLTAPPLWRKLLRARIAVPVPVALLLAMVFAAGLLWRFPPPAGAPRRIAEPAPTAAPARALPASSEPMQPAARVGAMKSSAPVAPARTRTDLAWTPVSRPEWRIVR